MTLFSNIKFNTVVVGEIGINHCGKIDKALSMIDMLSDIGVHVAKFQIFNPASLATTSKEIEFWQKYQLTADEFVEIKNYCCETGITFLATPSDRRSAELMISRLKETAFKLGSDDNDNPILMSYIVQRLMHPAFIISVRNVSEYLRSLRILRWLKSSEAGDLVTGDSFDVIPMYCVPEYPPDRNSVNLSELDKLRNSYWNTLGLVGYSNHLPGELGLEFCSNAIDLGADIIEVHVTEHDDSEPDLGISLDKSQLRRLIMKLRTANKNSKRVYTMTDLSERADIDLCDVNARRSQTGMSVTEFASLLYDSDNGKVELVKSKHYDDPLYIDDIKQRGV